MDEARAKTADQFHESCDEFIRISVGNPAGSGLVGEAVVQDTCRCQ